MIVSHPPPATMSAKTRSLGSTRAEFGRGEILWRKVVVRFDCADKPMMATSSNNAIRFIIKSPVTFDRPIERTTEFLPTTLPPLALLRVFARRVWVHSADRLLRKNQPGM